MSGKIEVSLRAESWKNIFRVLKWTAPMRLSIDEGEYHRREGEHWSLGNFWAAVQDLQRQVKAQENLTELARRIARCGPYPADHLAEGGSCGICGELFVKDQVLDICVEGPATPEDQAKLEAGEDFEGRVFVCHLACKQAAMEDEAGATKFTRRD